jgi:hypothetical protein
MGEKTWTVWVGGAEIKNYLMTHERALEVAEMWKDYGYDDVLISNYAVDK